MTLRDYKENDWRELHSLYNRCLYADKVTSEFFIEHLIFSPNFDPEGITLLEKNGKLTGAAVAQIVKRSPSPWNELLASAKDKGYLMPLIVSNVEDGKILLPAAEKYFKVNSRSRIISTALGPTLFPDGIDPEIYPAIHQVFEEAGYEKAGTSYSMSCNLETYRVPELVREKIESLSEEGITAKICSYEDIPKIRRFLEGTDLKSRMDNIADKIRRGELGQVIIIASPDEILGFCMYNYYGEAERVGPFGITKNMRGKGVGQVMVAKLLEIMQEKKYMTAYFVSSAKENTFFYAKNGFEIFRTKTQFAKTL